MGTPISQRSMPRPKPIVSLSRIGASRLERVGDPKRDPFAQAHIRVTEQPVPLEILGPRGRSAG